MNVTNHAVRTRERSRQILPPVQFESRGDPISIVDGAVDAILFAAVFALLKFLFGFDPRTVF